MRTLTRTLGIAVAAIIFGATVAAAQPGAPRREPPGPAAPEGVSPGEIQRLFDAYVVMQAQQALQLSDEQYPQFLARMKALQTARQRGLAARNRVLQELRRLGDASTIDESAARVQLKALADADAKTAGDVRDALAAIDQVLDVRQQVKFRLFEEQMERRKVDLLMRARQANRGRTNP